MSKHDSYTEVTYLQQHTTILWSSREIRDKGRWRLGRDMLQCGDAKDAKWSQVEAEALVAHDNFDATLQNQGKHSRYGAQVIERLFTRGFCANAQDLLPPNQPP